VGRNSEKQSTFAQVPDSAFVLLARICSMSGKTRVGLVVTAFSPGE
jgi:hypothetical protein